MGSYKIARRTFLRGVGGAVGFQAMLRTLEAGAQGVKPPPRFLLTHWPVGTVAFNFVPTGLATGTQASWTSSRILKPFEDAGLKGDIIPIFGLDQEAVGQAVGGGGHEGGTPLMTTGVRILGTRDGETETDDFYASGPSIDQILLKLAPALKTPGKGYVNAICDARVDLAEISTQCLSYGYATQNVAQVLPSRTTTATENVPLLPTLSPVDLYTTLFSTFMPGGPTPGNQDKLRRNLLARKRVLDFSLDELRRVRGLAPAADRVRLDIHAQSLANAEDLLQAQIAATMMPSTGGSCTKPGSPNPLDVGQADQKRRTNPDYNNPKATVADDALHERVGRAHMGLIKAAFQCDIVRVATFQWSPGTNHVSFAGLFPGEPNGIYMHHPTSHRITNRAEVLSSPTTHQAEVEFLTAVQTWYNARMASILAEWKNPTTGMDAYGGNVFDNTVIPYVTEVAETTHFPRNPMPAIIMGGKALGMKGGQFVNFGMSGRRPYNDLWFTIAQAYGLNVSQAPLSSELIARATHQGPIAGLWAAPS